MPKIFDCFTFFNENDVLAIRLEELFPVVDYFVIVQSEETFRGDPKPDFFDYGRFQQYAGKLILVTVPGIVTNNPWKREEHQRNSITLGLGEASDDDIILISDVDEIPRRGAIENLELNWHCRFRLDKYSYAINMLTGEGNTSVRAIRYAGLSNMSPQEVRKSQPSHIIENGGWEFSSLGTPADIMKKFRAFSHSEFDGIISEGMFAMQIANGKDLLGRDISMTPVEIDDTWPEAVKNDREYWKQYEW